MKHCLKFSLRSIVPLPWSFSIPLEDLEPSCYLRKTVSPSKFYLINCLVFQRGEIPSPSKSNNFKPDMWEMRITHYMGILSLFHAINTKWKTTSKEWLLFFPYCQESCLSGFQSVFGIKITFQIIQRCLCLKILFVNYFPLDTIFPNQGVENIVLFF